MEKEKKTNPWLEHVKKFREKHPKLSYKEVLQEAKKTYTKVKPKAKTKKEAKPKKEKKAKKSTTKGGAVDRLPAGNVVKDLHVQSLV